MSVETQAAELDDFGGLLDLGKLNAWIEGRTDVPGSGPLTGARKLVGGLANAVFMIERGGQSIVLRRPPKHLRPNSNETILREARLLKALGATQVPHPRFYAVCDDDSVIGAYFYLMEPIEGFSPIGQLPGEYGTNPAWRRTMGEELVRAAASLGSVDYKAVGLEDFGKPNDWHERQVERWRWQLEGYAETPGYNPADLPHFDEVGRWLKDNLPSDRRIGIIHGDFQFPNLMFSLKAPKVSGIIDWEIGTLGDPMLDFAWILTSWFEEGDPPGKKPMVEPWDGFPTRAELIRLYGELSGRDMSATPWFFALACYKLSVLLEGTVARAKAGKVPADVGEQVHGYCVWLMELGRKIIAG
jgi:aminoglycoside phosphotransferase (APT) family kinase protein